MVECQDKVWGKMFAKISYQFMQALLEVRNAFIRGRPCLIPDLGIT